MSRPPEREPLTDAERSLVIEDLARHKHGFGLAADYVAEASERSPSCGDEVTVRISADGTITWLGHGCTVSMAAASALGSLDVSEFTRLFEPYLDSVRPAGQPLDEHDLDVFAGIGRFPLRGQCATLAWRALAQIAPTISPALSSE